MQVKSPTTSAPASRLTAAGSDTWLAPLVQTLRPRQWSKNGIVFAGIVFSGRAFEPASIWRAVLAFALYCFLSSVVYLINDIADRDADRRHPIKRHRPVASGRLSIKSATTATVVLAAASLLGSVVLGPTFVLLSVAFVALNVAYSWRLKHEVILDIFCVAGGFVLRAAAGAVAVSVPISPWLYVCTVLLALFLGLSKRRYELLALENGGGATRKTLEAYTTALVEEMLAVVTSSTVIAYALYTFFADNAPRDHSMMLTIPFVLYGLFRYLYLVHTQRGAGNPDEVLLRDVPLLISIGLWGAMSLAILYYSRLVG